MKTRKQSQNKDYQIKLVLAKDGTELVPSIAAGRQSNIHPNGSFINSKLINDLGNIIKDYVVIDGKVEEIVKRGVFLSRRNRKNNGQKQGRDVRVLARNGRELKLGESIQYNQNSDGSYINPNLLNELGNIINEYTIVKGKLEEVIKRGTFHSRVQRSKQKEKKRKLSTTTINVLPDNQFSSYLPQIADRSITPNLNNNFDQLPRQNLATHFNPMQNQSPSSIYQRINSNYSNEFNNSNSYLSLPQVNPQNETRPSPSNLLYPTIGTSLTQYTFIPTQLVFPRYYHQTDNSNVYSSVTGINQQNIDSTPSQSTVSNLHANFNPSVQSSSSPTPSVPFVEQHQREYNMSANEFNEFIHSDLYDSLIQTDQQNIDSTPSQSTISNLHANFNPSVQSSSLPTPPVPFVETYQIEDSYISSKELDELKDSFERNYIHARINSRNVEDVFLSSLIKNKNFSNMKICNDFLKQTYGVIVLINKKSRVNKYVLQDFYSKKILLNCDDILIDNPSLSTTKNINKNLYRGIQAEYFPAFESSNLNLDDSNQTTINIDHMNDSFPIPKYFKNQSSTNSINVHKKNSRKKKSINTKKIIHNNNQNHTHNIENSNDIMSLINNSIFNNQHNQQTHGAFHLQPNTQNLHGSNEISSTHDPSSKKN